MTYHILTEPTSTSIPRKVLMRSVAQTRRRNAGKSTEYVNEDPAVESFTLSLADATAVPSLPTPDLPLLVPGDRISSGTVDDDHDDQVQ